MKRSLWSIGDGVREEREVIASFLLKSWEQDWGYWISEAVGGMWVHLLATCCSVKSLLWVSRGCLLRLVSETKHQMQRGNLERKTFGTHKRWECAG